jgi:hypothetical protein
VAWCKSGAGVDHFDAVSEGIVYIEPAYIRKIMIPAPGRTVAIEPAQEIVEILNP